MELHKPLILIAAILVALSTHAQDLTFNIQSINGLPIQFSLNIYDGEDKLTMLLSDNDGKIVIPADIIEQYAANNFSIGFRNDLLADLFTHVIYDSICVSEDQYRSACNACNCTYRYINQLVEQNNDTYYIETVDVSHIDYDTTEEGVGIGE